MKEEKTLSPVILQKKRKNTVQKPYSKDKYYKAFSLIIFFLIWQFISYLNTINGWFNPVFLPSPSMIIQTGYNYIVKGTLFMHIGQSFYRMFVGFVIGIIASIIFGVMITGWKFFENLFMPILNLIGPIPVFAFLPMFLIWFGIGENSKIALIAYATFIPMLGYVTDGIRSTDPYLIRSAASLGASKGQIIRKIYFNAALPNIFAGMKASLAFTFSALVVAEMMGASSGLGFIIVDAKNWFKMSDMFLAATLIGLEYTLFHAILTAAEKAVIRWKRDGLADAVES